MTLNAVVGQQGNEDVMQDGRLVVVRALHERPCRPCFFKNILRFNFMGSADVVDVLTRPDPDSISSSDSELPVDSWLLPALGLVIALLLMLLFDPDGAYWLAKRPRAAGPWPR